MPTVQQIIEEALASYQSNYRVEPAIDWSISVRRSEQTGNYELSWGPVSVIRTVSGLELRLPAQGLVVWINTDRAGLEDGMKLEGFKLVKCI